MSAVFGFGLATGGLLAFGYIAVSNWRTMLRALGYARGERGSLIFLAGPAMLVALVQGLHLATSLPGAAVASILLVGLLLDPAALPAVGFALYRRLRSTGRQD